MKAKKSFGQHFLTNEDIAAGIADGLLSDNGTQSVLEVGPGKGMLTKYLIDKGYDLKVVELDRDMIPILHRTFESLQERILEVDFLKLDLKEVFEDQPFMLIGNYPYNISSQIVFKMIDHRDLVPQMVGMFQKEVAKRIVATPTSKAYGVISVLTQAYYDGEYLFDVGPENFDPPPKVESGVIRLTRKKEDFDIMHPKLFKAIVKQAFSQRRKMLRNTMKSFLKDSEILGDKFFQQRPERVSVEQFIWLMNVVAEHTKGDLDKES